MIKNRGTILPGEVYDKWIIITIKNMYIQIIHNFRSQTQSNPYKYPIYGDYYGFGQPYLIYFIFSKMSLIQAFYKKILLMQPLRPHPHPNTPHSSHFSNPHPPLGISISPLQHLCQFQIDTCQAESDTYELLMDFVSTLSVQFPQTAYCAL